MASSNELGSLLEDILCGGAYFAGGVQNASQSTAALVTAVVDWGNKLGRTLNEIVSVVEPCLRQSILMSLIPAEAFDSQYKGSVDASIDRHLSTLGLVLSPQATRNLRNICLNASKLKNLKAKAARDSAMSLAQIRAMPTVYTSITKRQGGRCLWCGVLLNDPNVRETLEHMIPHHLGDDPSDGSNWGLACMSCNSGKADTLAWAAQSFAHDFFARSDFDDTRLIPLRPRWSVLMRSRNCALCSKTPRETELWVYRRIRTGLPIPANCAATCLPCARSNKLELIKPRWFEPFEARRGMPSI
jgi:hypothetical protein